MHSVHFYHDHDSSDLSNSMLQLLDRVVISFYPLPRSLILCSQLAGGVGGRHARNEFLAPELTSA